MCIRDSLITSDASVGTLDQAGANAVESEIAGLKIAVSALDDQKCVRCWHRRSDVGLYAAHPELCGRCVENIDGQGEVRLHA